MHNVTSCPSGNTTPVVSVIIPTYRRWDLLCDAIESVMSQTYLLWEIIVVNDCGGEPEGKAVDLLSDSRITYIVHETNLGLPAARNTGISSSAGKYIAYLDDDDIYYEDHLKILVSALEDNNWDVAYSLANEALYRQEGSLGFLVNKTVKYYHPYERVRFWKENFIPVNCMMHRRDCILEAGEFDISLPLFEDWDLWLRMSLRYDFHMIPLVTCEFRVRDDKSRMTTAATLDKWWKVKCRIYSKYLHDQNMTGDRIARKLLFSGISHFVRKNISWFRSAFSDTNMLPVYMELLKCVSPGTWFRMFIKEPWHTLGLAGRLIQGMVE